MPKPIRLTLHAAEMSRKRGVEASWIVAAIEAPEWTAADPLDPVVQRRFRAVPENGDRILRVACVETETEIRVITVLFDRDARKP